MKLIELHPQWMNAGGEGIFDANGNPASERVGVGILLNCPCGNSDESHQLYVPFANPLDGGPPIETGKNNGWQQTGETFDTLTLTPSILRSRQNCVWHGFITNGEIITV